MASGRDSPSMTPSGKGNGASAQQSYADAVRHNDGVEKVAAGPSGVVVGSQKSKCGSEKMPKPTYREIVSRMNGKRVTRFVGFGDHEEHDPKFIDYENNVVGIYGDGNCMFRAIAFVVNDPKTDHLKLRKEVCDLLAADPEAPEMVHKFGDHLKEMRKSGTFGEEYELVKAQIFVKHYICVWENGRKIAEYGQPDQPAIHLRYNREKMHYDLHIVAPSSLSRGAQNQSASQVVPVESDVGTSEWRVVTSRGAKRRVGRPKKLSRVVPKTRSKNASNGAIASVSECRPPVPKTKVGGPAESTAASTSDKEHQVDHQMGERMSSTSNNQVPRCDKPTVEPLQNSASSAAAAAKQSKMKATGPAVVPGKASRGRPKKRPRLGAFQKAKSITELPMTDDSVPVADNIDEAAKEAAAVSAHAGDAIEPTGPVCEDRGQTYSAAMDVVDPDVRSYPRDSPAHIDHIPGSDQTVVEEVARLTRAMLDDLIADCPHSITIKEVHTDLTSSSERGLDGPWSYRNSRYVMITYITGDDEEERRINLRNLKRRGFCGPSRGGGLRYKFYSWLRFKEIVKRSGRTVSAALDDEGVFHETLLEVDRLYSRNPRYVNQEGLEPHKGPQTWEDRYNLIQLHYYGKGWFSYYRLSTFRVLFTSRHGDERWAEFQADPWTETLTEEHFELLLSEVHAKLRQGFSRYTHMLEPFVGPQCHEDRGTASRTQYNVLFVNRTNDAGRGGRRNEVPMAQAPPQRIDTAASGDTGEPDTFFLRSCVACGKLRVLDVRAAAKYPLGSYSYAGRQQRVRFTCDRLVGITCEAPPDFVDCTAHDKPSTWVALATQAAEDQLPPSALQLRSLRVLDASDHTEEVLVLGSYHHRNDGSAAGWTGRRALLARTSNSGDVTLGTQGKGRRRRFQAVPGCRFRPGRFTVDSPREAKCCQPWHDPIGIDPEDPSAELRVTCLQVLRDIHSVYGALRRVRCIVCRQQTPGLPYSDIRIRVPELDGTVHLSPNSLVSDALAKSALLQQRSKCTIKLDPKFKGARDTRLTDRDAWGVCTTCSPSYIVDPDSNIVSRPLLPNAGLAADPDDADDFVDQPVAAEPTGARDAEDGDAADEPAPVSICKFSAMNLVATDVFSDEAYAQFVSTWTRAETMVLRSVHSFVTVLRLRANKVPFAKHGSICYPLKRDEIASCLPWCDFSTLPFVVMVQHRRDGTSTEAMVNMQTILLAKEYMERLENDPLDTTAQQENRTQRTRPHNRLVSEVPFSYYNLERLQQRLSESDRPCVPSDLRVVTDSDINFRADKALRFNEFRNWVESGLPMADVLWTSFALEFSGEGADTTNASVSDLWQTFTNYVLGSAIDSAVERHQQQNDGGDDGSDTVEIDVTMRHIVSCAVRKGWLLSATAGDDGDEPVGESGGATTLLLCCEELQILGQEFGNDEGGATRMAVGAAAPPPTERPDEIIQRGIAHSALHRIPMPAVDWQNPLPENMPGNMQKRFPEVLRSGDADPYQDRKVSIRHPETTWLQELLLWMLRQPEAEGNVEFQFTGHSEMVRFVAGKRAKVAATAVRTDDFPDGMPTKDELERDPALCTRLARSLLCFQSKLEDSDAFWRMRKQEMIGLVRYLEDPPSWRPNDIPLEVILWQTRAPPYNHHPAIHRLCDDAAVSEALSDARFWEARMANSLKHPGILSWVCCLMGDLDTLALARARYDSTYHIVRSEWGANGNPHIHRHIISEPFSRFLYELQNGLQREAVSIETEVRAEDPALEREVSRRAIETRIAAAWHDSQQQYIAHVRPLYTNWNAGLTKDGKRTYDFAYDRTTTVCRANMADMINDALTTGNFEKIDDIYVRVINGTLRHTGHSGHGDAPARKDACSVVRKVVDREATERARAEGRPRAVVRKEVVMCKRRMPRQLRTDAAVVPDAHDPRIKQCEMPCNDKWLGGHDPFAVLHYLNNIDDKAVVPAWLAKPPRVKWQQSPDTGGYHFEVVLAEGSGDSSVEYALKYGLKPVAPVRTPRDVLLTAMQHRSGGDRVENGDVKRMYNKVSASMCQPIFQIVHKNFQLPLLQKNVDVRGINVGGTRVLKPSTADSDPTYAFATQLERFDARLRDDIECGNIPREEFQRVMSVREFFDKFTVTEKRPVDGSTRFRIGRRHREHGGVFKGIALLPHHSVSHANVNRRQFWKFARDIVLWCTPCLRTSDLMPPTDNITDDAIAAHWRSKYEELMANGGANVPKWVHRYKNRYDAPADDDVDELRAELDDGGRSDEDDAFETLLPPEDDDERDLNAARVRDRFYQTNVDAMAGCRPEDADDAAPQDDRDPAFEVNPDGHFFQDEWLGDRTVNPEEVRRKYADLARRGAGDAEHAAPAAPSGRQLVLPRIVSRYVVAQRQWVRSLREWNAYDKAMSDWRRSRSARGPEPVAPSVPDIRQSPPKALRAFLLGDPGAGKSTTLRSTVHELIALLADDVALLADDGSDWTDVVKLSAPTGCASFHMAHGAETIHRTYAIRVGQTNDDPMDPTSPRFAALCRRLGRQLGLIIFDEFSMIQRRMIRWVVTRLEEAGVDLEHIGVLFVGDPAQILPIGDSPVWSLRRRTDDDTDVCEASLLGMIAFRTLFRMPALETVPGFATWRESIDKDQRRVADNERRQVARFRAAAMDGDYETVYLDEVRRTVDNDELSAHFTRVVIPSFRYGRASSDNLQWLRDNTATAEHMTADPAWKDAVTLHGHHWHSEWKENRATVESDNAKALVEFANERRQPVMSIDAQHIPAKKAPRLQKVSAKEFRGVPSRFHACSDLPLMLLENIAPSLGLFNGAHVQFVGPLYLNDDWQVSLTKNEYASRVETSGVTLSAPLDTPASDRDRMYQIPAGSVILQVNDDAVNGDPQRLSELVGASTGTVRLVFSTPKRPPHLPEFIVVRAPGYTESGGPNVLGIDDARDLVPIRMVKRGREKRNSRKANAHGDDRHTEFRVGPPLEGGSAFTGFKGQGATLKRVRAKVKEWVGVPGFWTVVVSRVRHPHHLHIPDGQWPTDQELEMQRLNDDVIEAEIFERQMKINAAKTWRHYVAAEGDGDWTQLENAIGDAVNSAWRRRHERDVVADVCDELRANGTDVSTADVQGVIDKMIVTDESLILAEPVYVSLRRYVKLFQCKPQRGRRRSAGAAVPKRKGSTSAGRGRPAKTRRVAARSDR